MTFSPKLQSGILLFSANEKKNNNNTKNKKTESPIAGYISSKSVIHLSQLKGAQSRYFELFWPHTKLPLNGRKPENNSLIRWKNTREIMINHK